MSNSGGLRLGCSLRRFRAILGVDRATEFMPTAGCCCFAVATTWLLAAFAPMAEAAVADMA